MYKVEVFSDFSAAHRLRGYKGKCENLHGHNWKVGVSVAGRSPDTTGIVADFRLLKKKLKAVLKELDHRDLNAHPYFKKINPTSENIAKFVYDRMKRSNASVSSVSVWEAEDAKATYFEP